MNQESIQQYLTNKTARQVVLNERKKELEDLDVDLWSAKFGRFFGTTYFRLKRIITFILGVLLIIFAVIILLGYVDDKIPMSQESDRIIFGIVPVVTGLLLLYISYLTRLIRIRNSRISEAQSLTQDVILKYIEDIESQNKELHIIRSICESNTDLKEDGERPDVAQ